MKVKQINFYPKFDSMSKGFLGFINTILETDEGEELQLNSCSVYTRISGEGKIKILNPAKKIGSAYKYYFILPPLLKAKIEEATLTEIKKLGLWDFKLEEKEIFN